MSGTELTQGLVLTTDNTFSSKIKKLFNFNPLSLEKFYNDFLQDFPDGIFLVDKNGEILWVNTVAKRFMEMTKAFSSFGNFENSLLSIIINLAQSSLQNKRELFNREVSCIINGQSITFLLDIFLIRENHRIVGTILIAKDITRLKSINEASTYCNMRGFIHQVASGLAHEIRNPLTTVRGFIQLTQNSLKVSPKKEYLQVALDELDRANNLIKDFLLYVRPAAPNFILVSLEQVIEEAIKRVKQKALLKDIIFEYTSFGDSPLMYLDVEQISQAFGNILENAVDFSEQGIIEISALNVEKSDKTIITFKDSGCGIPDKNMSRLFEPFFTTKEEAPGLGLTLAQSIIKNHGGEICIANNPDKGVSVTVHLYHVSKYPDQNQNP
jgi:signal transduction histidine kinase